MPGKLYKRFTLEDREAEMMRVTNPFFIYLPYPLAKRLSLKVMLYWIHLQKNIWLHSQLFTK